MRRLMLLAVLVALLAGCSSAAPETSADVPVGTPAAPADPTATTAPVTDDRGAPQSEPDQEPDPAATEPAAPFEADTSPDTSEGRGPLVTLTDVRTGAHDGFDRVVFDLGGGGVAGWTVRYVDRAVAQGSGEPVQVAGAAVLEVDLVHTGYPDDTGVAFYDGPRRISGATVVREAVLTGAYEGHTQLFVGVSARRAFRVYAIDGRVVLDVLREDFGAGA